MQGTHYALQHSLVWQDMVHCVFYHKVVCIPARTSAAVNGRKKAAIELWMRIQGILDQIQRHVGEKRLAERKARKR